MKLIKKTKIKFVAITSALMLIVISIFCASILISTHTKNASNIHNRLEQMINNYHINGEFSPPPFTDDRGNSGNRFNDIRGFSIFITNDGKIERPLFNQEVFTEAEIDTYIVKIVARNKESGKVDTIQFLIKKINTGQIICGLDISMENEMFQELLGIVLLAGAGGMLILFILIYLLSFWIVKPIANAFYKQKRFISDAGHEIKTPLTIILTSIDLLANCNQEDCDKWHKTIKEQADKMSLMTTELLTLSKLEETEKTIMTEIALSQLVLSECLSFEAVAFENGKTLTCQIESDIFCKGNSQAVQQALAIVCDNAIKYSNQNSLISIQLKKQAGKVIFSITNECNYLHLEEIPFLFERFYRGNESRAIIRGSGLGLSILKTLAEKNHWNINVEIKEKIIIFTIIF